MARSTPWFDEVWIDERPRWRQPGGWLSLRARLRGGRFDRIYDLQTQGRTALYYRLFWPGPVPEWSGIARGCSHPHADPLRATLHASEIYRGQLRDAGIDDVPPPELDWLDTDLGEFDLPLRYALLVPGSAPHRPEKRWPAESFTELARHLARRDITPLVVGGAPESDVIGKIAAACPAARGLAGRTDLLQLGGLARRAIVAIGNDTGPMHLIAAAGCPSLVLFSGASEPARAAPQGASVAVLQRAQLADLPVETVWQAVFSLVPDLEGQTKPS